MFYPISFEVPYAMNLVADNLVLALHTVLGEGTTFA
jgi:hypothetical protein